MNMSVLEWPVPLQELCLAKVSYHSVLDRLRIILSVASSYQTTDITTLACAPSRPLFGTHLRRPDPTNCYLAHHTVQSLTIPRWRGSIQVRHSRDLAKPQHHSKQITNRALQFVLN